MFVCCECCVLSGRGLRDEVITRLEESYRLWCVVVCDLETSWMRRPWPTKGLSPQTNKLKNNRLYAFLQNTYNPVPTDKGNAVSFVLCSTMIRGISCWPPVKVGKILYALCKF